MRLIMTTILAKTTRQDDSAPLLLTDDELAAVGGGLRVPDPDGCYGPTPPRPRPPHDPLPPPGGGLP